MQLQFEAHIQRRIALAQPVQETLGPVVARAAALLFVALETGHKVLLCGNGGSAADAQHLAAELTTSSSRICTAHA